MATAINLFNRDSKSLAANTRSEKLFAGTYDVRTTVETLICVIKADRSIDIAKDYPIPANVIVPVNVPDGYYIKANAPITITRVD